MPVCQAAARRALAKPSHVADAKRLPFRVETAVENDPIFQPLHFRNLTVKNRLFRSSISGRFDNYNGHGNQARINWETKFARGGIGAIITSFVPIHVRGRILPNYAMIDHDDKIPFCLPFAESVHYPD